MAVATSETSARVGIGLSIIDSSICVATITGLAMARHLRTSRFWIGGTFCTGSSTPRSPRATMIPSLTARMSSKHFTAAGFSIFDRIAARPLVRVRASFTSSGRCTKLSASQSTPNSQTNSRSARSLSDSAASGRTTSGTFTPLRFEMVPPITTSQSDLAVVDQKVGSRFQRCEDLGVGQADAACVTLGLVKIEPERRALDQFFLTVRECPDAQFRPLKVGQNGDRAVQILFDLANDAVTLGDLAMFAMAHVEAKDIRSGLVQGADRVVIRRGGAKRGHDLDIAVASHLCSFVSRRSGVCVIANIHCLRLIAQFTLPHNCPRGR